MYIIGEIIAKDNLNIANLMQTFENLLLQKYLPEFFYIAHKYSLGMCKFVQMVLPPGLGYV